MLKEIDEVRLKKIENIIKQAHIRFPISEIEKRMGVNKGNVSAYLSGKKPMPEKFYQAILREFGNENIEPVTQEANILSDDIANRILMNEAKIDVLFQSVVQLHVHATGKQAALISAELQQAIELTIKGRIGK